VFRVSLWADSTIHPCAYHGQAGDVAAGYDPLIGQRLTNGPKRTFTLQVEPQSFETLTLTQAWVIPMGGGYFFAPSITALKTVLVT